MKLSARETAILLARNIRTVRRQLARGELPGKKKNGRWVVDRDDLPLNESQRRTLQAKASRLRQALEDALPSRRARTYGDRSRSLADLDAFRLGAELLAEVRSHSDVLDERRRERLEDQLENGLLAVAEATFQFDRDIKLAALNRARAELARASATLLLAEKSAAAGPAARWVRALEVDVLPAVAGFARWTDKLGSSQR